MEAALKTHLDRPFRAVTFPSDDHVFAARVREILALHGLTRPDVERLLKERLSLVHPHVSVTFRDSLAGFGDNVIYVFRDGGARSRLDPHNWIEEPSIGRVVTDENGTYLDANDEAAALFGVPREEIIGASAGSFTRPDARISDAGELWRALDKTGVLHSLALVRSRDGDDRHVEFYTVRNGNGPGRNVTYLRLIA